MKVKSNSLGEVEVEEIRAELDIAVKLLDKGEFDKAAQKFRAVKKKFPNISAPYIGLGDIYSAKGEHNKALENYDQALKIAPSSELYNNIGAIHFIQGDESKAESSFNSAITLDDKNVYAKKNLADLCFKQEKYKDAIPLYEAGLLVQPESDSFLGLANCYFKLGRYESAKYGYEKVLEIEPKNKIAKENLKIVNEKLKD